MLLKTVVKTGRPYLNYPLFPLAVPIMSNDSKNEKGEYELCENGHWKPKDQVPCYSCLREDNDIKKGVGQHSGDKWIGINPIGSMIDEIRDELGITTNTDNSDTAILENENIEIKPIQKDHRNDSNNANDIQTQITNETIPSTVSPNDGVQNNIKNNIWNTEYGIILIGFSRLFTEAFGVFPTQKVEDMVGIAANDSYGNKLNLLKNYERDFISSLARIMPDDYPEILTLLYGLDGKMPRNMYRTAMVLKISEQRLNSAYKRIVAFLSSSEGGEIIKKRIENQPK